MMDTSGDIPRLMDTFFVFCSFRDVITHCPWYFLRTARMYALGLSCTGLAVFRPFCQDPRLIRRGRRGPPNETVKDALRLG